MIVFIEGVDGSGKTTLYNMLKECDYKTFTLNSHSTEIYDWLKLSVTSEMYNQVVITDRACFITDLVYRLVDKQPRRGMSFQEMSEVLSNNVKIIYCKTNTSYDDAMQRGEDNITNKVKHRQISKMYDMIMDIFSIFGDIPILTYNWKKDKLSDVIKFIEGGN